MSKHVPSTSAPPGWSATMRRWLAAAVQAEPAVRWTALIDDGQHTEQVSLDEIAAVRVQDLSQVLEHRIARIVGSTSHVIRFIGGGELRYAYNSRGQVIELSATGVRGAVSEHRVVTFGNMVDYHELGRLGGSFPHDANASFLKTASVAKINADKRPVNLSLMDLPKMPHKGIDAVWAHGDEFTVTEAKARGSIHAVMAMANGPRVPKTISGLDGRLLYTLLSTSKSEEGDGKPVIQMSEDWVASRASMEDLGPGPERAITLGHCDRRVVLVTLEAKGASDHVQALAEIKLECDPELANSHTSHGRIKEWGKSDIDRVAAARQKHEIDRSAKRSGASAGAKRGGGKRDVG